MIWQRASVSPCGTHHVLDGAPLYAERFDAVLKFHPPGLAPVRRGRHAWHVNQAGQPAYTRRYARTFGFYEGLAAVVEVGGWCHVDPSGEALYVERHAWCGNYQGGRCAVRTVEGAYLHLDEAGRPAYAARHRYAGDYRDGLAVVQGEDGLSTHIDAAGRPVHERRFVDLDVFHKGFARARDAVGWMHVDIAGRPVYERRFAAVEPFYNGQARVEDMDGGLSIIGEDGGTLVALRSPRGPR